MRKHLLFSLLFLLGSGTSLWAMMPIDTTASFSIAPGCDYMAVRWLRQNDDPNSGINSFILRVDAKNPNVSFGQRLGKGTLMGREKLSKMARRFNAPLGTNPVCIAAVNGDFFWMENEDRENGLLRGFTVQDNEFVVTTDEKRLLGGITEDKLGLVGTLGEWTGSVTMGQQTLPLARVNYKREANELVLFNQYNDSTTGTDANGTEVLLSLLPGQQWHSNCTIQATVQKIEKNMGSMAIPASKIVLSGSGKMAKELNKVHMGDTITIQMTFTVDGVATNYNQCIGSDQYATILKDGVVETENFWQGEHPRNSFGYTQSRDTFFFVIVDGRIPESPGCTTSELGEMMRQIGCYNATNWDGGRSAHLWLRGHGFMNKGCDKEKRERAISNGMFIFYQMEHPINRELDSLLQADPSRAGGNYHGYEFHEIVDEPAPKGYVPFYISHYGRHGSRSKSSSKPYYQLLNWLTTAEANHNLTPQGEQLLAFTKELILQYDSMPGRLTDKGEKEHALLAQRMYNRFPEVFQKGNNQIYAIASQSPRCLVSMNAFTNQLARMDADLRFDLDCGKMPQKIISPASDDPIEVCVHTRDSLTALLPDDTVEVYNRLFLRPDEAKKLFPARELQDDVYDVVVTAQCFDLMDNVYTYLPPLSVYRREVQMAWKVWVHAGNNDLQTAYRRPGVQIALNDFMDRADSAIHTGAHCADLRFGHDTQLLTILAAMGVSGVGDKMTPEQVEYRWYTYQQLPMGLNLQLVFYHPKKKAAAKCSDDEILVKVLYNEAEHQLNGLQPVSGTYYRWSDVKKLWGK